MSSNNIKLTGNKSIKSITNYPGSVTINNQPMWSSGGTFIGGQTLTKLFNYNQSVIFNSNNDENTNIMLGNCFSDIEDNIISFTPIIDSKFNEPIELLFKVINDETLFDLEIHRTNYDIKIKDIKILAIQNLFSKESIGKINVKFTYTEYEYINTILSIEEKRNLKIKKIKNLIEDL